MSIHVNIPWVEPEDFIVAVAQLQEIVQELLDREAGIKEKEE